MSHQNVCVATGHKLSKTLPRKTEPEFCPKSHGHLLCSQLCHKRAVLWGPDLSTRPDWRRGGAGGWLRFRPQKAVSSPCASVCKAWSSQWHVGAHFQGFSDCLIPLDGAHDLGGGLSPGQVRLPALTLQVLQHSGQTKKQARALCLCFLENTSPKPQTGLLHGGCLSNTPVKTSSATSIDPGLQS